MTIEAEKYTRIIARQGKVGETVISWSSDSNGNEIKEKVAQVQVDQETKKPDWIATKVDENGDIVIDNNNHPNQWIINDTTFSKKYEIDQNNTALFKPIGGKQIFVRITDNITLNQWGEEINISAGGYINITNQNDMYGISQRDFENTYKVVSDFNKTKHKL